MRNVLHLKVIGAYMNQGIESVTDKFKKRNAF